MLEPTHMNHLPGASLYGNLLVLPAIIIAQAGKPARETQGHPFNLM